MRPVFHPRLVNGAFEDPALYIPLAFSRQALLFDLGDLSALSSRDILKLSHIFVSHTHIDHFIGFDHVLRLLLGRPKMLHVFGPQGFLDNIGGKLSAYTWNLVDRYSDALVIQATEIDNRELRTRRYDCRTGFAASSVEIRTFGEEPIYRQPEFSIHAQILDHRTPSLGFCIQERIHINIMKARLDSLGLATGPWLTEFKRLIHTAADPATEIHAPISSSMGANRVFSLGALSNRIARITAGQKTAYITDALYSPENEARIVRLAQHADHLFIEAVFLDSERDIARAKYHLTARQAGVIARNAQVKQFTLFHHSPRYLGREDLLIKEARQAFEQGA